VYTLLCGLTQTLQWVLSSMVMIILAQQGQAHCLVPPSSVEFGSPDRALAVLVLLCELSDKLMEMDDELAALDAATAVQIAKDVDWCLHES
jgi:hypothetical protein